MKKIAVVSLLAIAGTGITACGDTVVSQQELSELTVGEFALKACEAIREVNYEQLQEMLEVRELEKLNKEIKEQGSESALAAIIEKRLTCEITNSKVKRDRDDYTDHEINFSRAEIEIRREKGTGNFSVTDVDL